MYLRGTVLSDNGYNFLTWDCERDGCFNKVHRLKFHVFADCFPNKINFSDVDGIVEMKGKVLMLEWKSKKGTLPLGQQIMYTRISITGDTTVLCIVGSAETMECTHYGFFWKGKWNKYRTATLLDIKDFIKRWVGYVTIPY